MLPKELKASQINYVIFHLLKQATQCVVRLTRHVPANQVLTYINIFQIPKV